MRYKIRELREQQGLTQDALARMSGITRATLWGLETDDTKVTTTATLQAVAQALGVTVSELIDED